MNEPRYTYTAEAPCFSITHSQPFVLKGCSCGWPITSCLKRNASNLADREKAYEATIHILEGRAVMVGAAAN